MGWGGPYDRVRPLAYLLLPRSFVPAVLQGVRAFASEALKPKFTSKYLIQHVSEKLIPAVKEFEKQYQAPVIHLGRVLSVGDGIARIYGLKSVQVRAGATGRTDSGTGRRRL